ncbi:MAG TPA: ATP-binding protein, partial [Streptomyces sp.]|nr:ATP-binding protein [Streptomyces sp.]
MSMRWGEADEADTDAPRAAAAETDLAAGLTTGAESVTARASLPGDVRAPSAARTFVSRALAGWEMPDASLYDAVLLVSELVTNAVVHAGTAVQLECRPERGALVVEVADLHPTRAVETRAAGEPGEPGADGRWIRDGHQGHGLRLVAALADEWGVSYRRDGKTVWFRLPWEAKEPPGLTVAPIALPKQADGGRAQAEPVQAEPVQGEPAHDVQQHGTSLTGKLAPSSQRSATGSRSGADWIHHGILSFLAEASDLLAGQTDEDRVASLAGQLLVPRFADWCAVWLADTDTGAPPRLARVWHTQEDRIDELRSDLEKAPPVL